MYKLFKYAICRVVKTRYCCNTFLQIMWEFLFSVTERKLKNMKNRKLIALIAVLAIFAAACGQLMK